MEFNLNGVKKIFDGNHELSLLKYLRECEGITSPKDGCSPQAACGCCVVELNQRAVLSCVIPMSKVEGGQVVTIEGLGEYKQRVFANAFVSKGGVQCGFCIPGMVMQAKILLDKRPDPSREEVAKTLTQNLCRCTGYKKIEESILTAAEAIREGKEILYTESKGEVGGRHPKYQADKLVLGQRPYVADMKVEGVLFGALKLSDHPRA